jgi:hypothetical protein
LESVLQAATTTSGPMLLKYYKEFSIGGPAGDALRDRVRVSLLSSPYFAASHRLRLVSARWAQAGESRRVC